MQQRQDEVEQPQHRCRNPECRCLIAAGQRYCSEYCRRTGEYAGFEENHTGELGCDCWHRECAPPSR